MTCSPYPWSRWCLYDLRYHWKHTESSVISNIVQQLVFFRLHWGDWISFWPAPVCWHKYLHCHSNTTIFPPLRCWTNKFYIVLVTGQVFLCPLSLSNMQTFLMQASFSHWPQSLRCQLLWLPVDIYSHENGIFLAEVYLISWYICDLASDLACPNKSKCTYICKPVNQEMQLKKVTGYVQFFQYVIGTPRLLGRGGDNLLT